MKKLLSITCILISLLLTACSAQPQAPTEAVPEVQHNRYITTGRYYTDGSVITADGNEWGYSTDTISDRPAENAMPVYVAFDDNGTANNIYDDSILGLVLDLETYIYDRLESTLSESEAFTIERDGNNITIITTNKGE